MKDIQDALTTIENFPKFMPYVRSTKFVSKNEDDGSLYNYTELGFPVISDRDYVVQVWLDGGWHLVDATGLAPIEGLVLICVGRDATDIAFMTIFGMGEMRAQSVAVSRIDQ